ncbi:MAG: peroxiredoxin [Chitinophagales bacterium]|nr:peroxiredoxin [Chitinophagales bacterium]
MGNLANVGTKFPRFSKKAVVSLEKGKEFETISNDIHEKDGKWLVIYFYPKDFTFVCPTEIAEFNKHFEDFRDRDAVLIGASTDSEFVHLAWRNNHDDLRGLKYPLLADTSKSLSEDLGILNEDEKICFRATFIVDPQGMIRWVSVYDLSVGRNVAEVVRVLDALQTDELCPCNWEKGQATLG